VWSSKSKTSRLALTSANHTYQLYRRIVIRLAAQHRIKCMHAFWSDTGTYLQMEPPFTTPFPHPFAHTCSCSFPTCKRSSPTPIQKATHCNTLPLENPNNRASLPHTCRHSLTSLLQCAPQFSALFREVLARRIGAWEVSWSMVGAGSFLKDEFLHNCVQVLARLFLNRNCITASLPQSLIVIKQQLLLLCC